MKPVITKVSADFSDTIWSYLVEKTEYQATIEHFATHSAQGIEKIFGIGDRRQYADYTLWETDKVFEIYVIHTGATLPTGCTRQIDSVRIEFRSYNFYRDIAHLMYIPASDALRIFYFSSSTNNNSPNYETSDHPRESSTTTLKEFRLTNYFSGF